jgi:hypothetical protein
LQWSAKMSLNGKKIAFTGALQMKRKDAEKQAEEAGATVIAVFTGKNADVLVCGSGGKKTDDQKQAFYEAQKKAFASVEVWTEEEFTSALSGGGGGSSSSGKKRGADAAAPAAKAAKKTKASEEGSTAPAVGVGRCPERDGKGFCKIPKGTLSKVNPKPQTLQNPQRHPIKGVCVCVCVCVYVVCVRASVCMVYVYMLIICIRRKWKRGSRCCKKLERS